MLTSHGVRALEYRALAAAAQAKAAGGGLGQVQERHVAAAARWEALAACEDLYVRTADARRRGVARARALAAAAST